MDEVSVITQSKVMMSFQHLRFVPDISNLGKSAPEPGRRSMTAAPAEVQGVPMDYSRRA